MGKSKVTADSWLRKSRAKPKAVHPILAVLQHYEGYGYTTIDPSYPETLALPNVAKPAVRQPHEARAADCTVFVGGVVMALTLDCFNWTGLRYKEAMVMYPDRPWSAVDVWGRAVASWTRPEGCAPWKAVQGWSGLLGGRVTTGSRGHQWLLDPRGRAWHLSRSQGKLVQAGAVPQFAETRFVEL